MITPLLIALISREPPLGLGPPAKAVAVINTGGPTMFIIFFLIVLFSFLSVSALLNFNYHRPDAVPADRRKRRRWREHHHFDRMIRLSLPSGTAAIWLRFQLNVVDARPGIRELADLGALVFRRESLSHSQGRSVYPNDRPDDARGDVSD